MLYFLKDRIVDTLEELDLKLNPAFVKLSEGQEYLYNNHKELSVQTIKKFKGNLNEVEDFLLSLRPSLEALKVEKLQLLEEYDSSEAVNSFYLDNQKIWLERDLRVSLANTVSKLRSAGRETITIWFNTMYFSVSLDKCESILTELELYALECFNVTAHHRTQIQAAQTEQELSLINIYLGYPEKLHLFTQESL